VELDLAPQVKDALIASWEPVYRSQLHYLVTWSTRGRRPVLKPRHAEAVQGLVERTCDDREYGLIEVAVTPDAVRVLLALRPTQSVASAVRELKGRTSMTLMQEHPELRVWLKGNLLWDERYAVETVSPMRLGRAVERLQQGLHRDLPHGDHPEFWASAG
jgi:REP element-mobilizing transposase RayT